MGSASSYLKTSSSSNANKALEGVAPTTSSSLAPAPITITSASNSKSNDQDDAALASAIQQLSATKLMPQSGEAPTDTAAAAAGSSTPSNKALRQMYHASKSYSLPTAPKRTASQEPTTEAATAAAAAVACDSAASASCQQSPQPQPPPNQSPSSSYSSQTSSSVAASSPNAKLPPIRHPKSKLIIKNMQNKVQQQQQKEQQQQQQQQQQVLPATQPQEQDTTTTTASTSTSAAAAAAPTKTGATGAAAAVVQLNGKLDANTKMRSSSSSSLEKRSSGSKKSARPKSANQSSMAPVYKKLRPIEDPITQILDQIHKIVFIAQLAPSGRKNVKRKLVDRFKRSLFGTRKSSAQIKSELMRLIKNSNELVDNDMIGLKSFQYFFDVSSSTSSHQQQQQQQQQLNDQPQPPPAVSANTENNNTSSMQLLNDMDLILNHNSISYEQLQSIIEELLVENNYYTEHCSNSNRI